MLDRIQWQFQKSKIILKKDVYKAFKSKNDKAGVKMEWWDAFQKINGIKVNIKQFRINNWY